MRDSGTVDSPPAAPGSHVCWLFHGDDEFRRAAVDFLVEGERNGERLLFVADRPSTDQLLVDLRGLGEVGRRVDDGSLAVATLDSVFAPGRPIHRRQQVEHYRELLQAARDDGYSGLRLAADATTLVTTDASRRRLADYELAVDAVVAELSLSAMCGYDRGTLGPAGAELSVVHPLRHPGNEADPAFSFFRDADGSFHLAGEVDFQTRTLFEAALATVATVAGSEVVLDIGALAFADAAAIAALWRWASALRRAGRTLRLPHTSALALRCFAIIEATELVAAAAEDEDRVA